MHKNLQVILAVLAATWHVAALGQAAQPPQIIGVCGSQPNLPTVYFSGVMQGPATAWQGFQAGFNAYLSQHYAYKGAVGCAPAASVAQAQTAINTRATQLRNGKKMVVETGWTEASAPAVPAAVTALLAPAPVASATAAAPVPKAQATAGSASGSSDMSQLSSILGSVFGGGGTGAAPAPAASGGQPKSGAAAAPSAAGGATQSPFQQVSGALSSAFSSKSTNGPAPNGAGPKGAAPPADGALGTAQWQTTKLVVFGCGRQELQVACVTELTNQNQKDTLIQAVDVWKDAFIVDDRGDRHQRSSGFFLNVDGDQRPQLDVSYGKTARFILMFDGVQAKVQKVALRSVNGGLDVEEIGLIAPGQSAQTH